MINKTVAIIQARMGSKRFPGKMMAKLGSQPIIEWIFNRVKMSSKLDDIVLATTNLQEDAVLVNYADNYGINVYRGSELNVLKRFADAAKIYEANIIIRICADNPFIDPNEIDRLIKYYNTNSCDYAFNHQNKINSKYADGFGAEIFSVDVLKQILEKAISKENKEHVTQYIWENQETFNIEAVYAPEELSYPNLRFDVDTEDDLLLMSMLVDDGIDIDSSASEIITRYNLLIDNKILNC